MFAGISKLEGTTVGFVLNLITSIWRYPILTYDGNNITFGTLTTGIVFFVIGIKLSRKLTDKVSKNVIKKLIPERGAQATIETFTFYFFVIFFTLFAMKMANVPLTIFTVVGGALAIGIGFGSQNIVNNFISGLVLMVERPVKVGDFIEVDGILGQIEIIGMRSTTISVLGNRHIIVPNSTFLEKPVKNWTHSDRLIRISVEVGVAYGSPTEKVAEILKMVTTDHPRTSKKEDVMVLFKNFGESSLDFEVIFWIDIRDLNDSRVIESDIRFAIDLVFRKQGIEIPFPQRDINFKNNLPVEFKDDGPNPQLYRQY